MKYLTVIFGTKASDAEIFIDQAEVKKAFVKVRQSQMKVHAQSSGENSVTGKDLSEEEMRDLEKIET